jgi:hypothetical protein
LILDVEREGVPIRGWLSIASGVERRFHGWLELADALEAGRDRSASSRAIRSVAHQLIADGIRRRRVPG